MKLIVTAALPLVQYSSMDLPLKVFIAPCPRWLHESIQYIKKLLGLQNYIAQS